jgi:hypothetical protein
VNAQPVEIERVDIRSVWPGEARDFTPWLADNLDTLSGHLGISDLELEATEVPIPGGRNLDVLAVDSGGENWAIENQYGIGDHDHLTRGLAYAVALECRALVVVAEGHREEFIAVAAEWNRYSEAYGPDGIRVFLAVVEAWRIGDSAPGFRFRLVEGPNEWKVSARSSAAKTAAQSERHEANHLFWSQLLPLISECTRLYSGVSPRTGPWIGASNGAFYYQVWVKSDACHVQLRIDSGDGDENASLFDELSQQRGAVDEAFGPGLDWNPAEENRACFIRYDVPGSCGWKTPTDERQAGLETVASAVARLHEALSTHVDRLA